jgi:N-acetyl-1-D-myo-inositol-2-amino-2-deoxy-alpha-D-glucopyranoside deacetylase
MSMIDDARRVMLVHAHPDDETIATGALIAELVDRGVEVGVLTATRGELGEVVEGPLRRLAGTPELSAVRANELRDALELLGVSWHAYLGRRPARAEGVAERDYHDSGMRWIRPGLAGPDENVSADALTSAELSEVAADLAAAIAAYAPDLVITYDEGGGYGHPDHLVCYQATRMAMTGGSRRLAVVVTDEGSSAADSERIDAARHLPTVVAALRAHATQVRVDGTDIVHSGGQREPISTSVLLRGEPV